MTPGPLDRARAALLDARSLVEHSPSATNLKALAEAQAHIDYLLDVLPRSPEPGDASNSPGSVS